MPQNSTTTVTDDGNTQFGSGKKGTALPTDVSKADVVALIARIIFPIIYLRKYGNMSYDSSRQAGTEKTEEIAITPEMIDAGVSELSRWVSPEAIEPTPAIWRSGCIR